MTTSNETPSKKPVSREGQANPFVNPLNSQQKKMIALSSILGSIANNLDGRMELYRASKAALKVDSRAVSGIGRSLAGSFKRCDGSNLPGVVRIRPKRVKAPRPSAMPGGRPGRAVRWYWVNAGLRPNLLPLRHDLS